MDTKFNTIYESYINRNISWVKSEVKKLTKTNRKQMYLFVYHLTDSVEDTQFFFNLI